MQQTHDHQHRQGAGMVVMTASVLITGAMFRAPEQKTSKSGKTYVKATIKAKAADNSFEFWNLLCFSEAASAELLRLQDGDRLSVQGALKLEIYEGRIQRTVFVNAVLALRQPPKAKKSTAKAPPPSTTTGVASGYPDLNDPIPF
jgi:hypothetical protein